MTKIVSSTSLLLSGGLETPDSTRVSAKRVQARLRYLADIVQSRAQDVVTTHWNAADLQLISSGVDASGRNLPSSGHAALARLGWDSTEVSSMYVPDRVKRLGREAAARTLRQATTNDMVIAAIVSTWPVDPRRRTRAEWESLWAAVPSGTPKAVIRNRTHQIAVHLQSTGVLPGSITDLEEPPALTNQLLFAAADGQLVKAQRTGATYELVLKLPTVPSPANRSDWTWVHLQRNLPKHVSATATVSSPTVRFKNGRVYADVALTDEAPDSSLAHRRAIGLDWGVTDLAAAARARITGGGTIRVAAGRAVFSGAEHSVKQHSLRIYQQNLWAKISHQDRLLAGRTDPRLACKRDTLATELGRVGHKRRNMNRNTARMFARWAVHLAVQHRATVIYVEDLSTLEAGGLGATTNARVSQQLRGMAFTALRHAASKQGIVVVTVPPRGTSSTCATCLAPVRHPVHKQSECAHCGVRMDRDHMAAERIASRGLAGQATTRRPKGKPAAIRNVTDKVVVRDKTTPTPKRRARRHPKGRRAQIPAAVAAAQRRAGQYPRPTGQVLPENHTLSPFGGASTGGAWFAQVSSVLQV